MFKPAFPLVLSLGASASETLHCVLPVVECLFKFSGFAPQDLVLFLGDLDLGLEVDDSGSEALDLCVPVVQGKAVLALPNCELLLLSQQAVTIRAAHSVDVFLEAPDVVGCLLLEAGVLLPPGFAFFEELLVEADAGSAVALAEVFCHRNNNRQRRGNDLLIIN